MSKICASILLICLLSGGLQAAEASAETIRLKGFAEHQSRQKRNETAREKGEVEYLEEKDQWERQKDRALDDYKKQKKQSIMSDDGPEARADAAAKKKLENAREDAQELYLKEKSRQAQNLKRGQGVPTEEEELDIYSDRPRYDVKYRADFGGKPNYSQNGRGRPSGGLSGGGSGRPSSPSLPSPPRFNEFENGDNGDPPIIEDFGDIPPPPPPLPPGMDEEFNSDFPPPPPPPVFDGGDQGDF